MMCSYNGMKALYRFDPWPLRTHVATERLRTASRRSDLRIVGPSSTPADFLFASFIAGYGPYSIALKLIAWAAIAPGFGFCLLESTVFQTVYVKEVISLRDKPKPGEEGIGWFALIRSPTGESQRCLRSGLFRLVRGWCPETVPRKRA